MKMFKEDSLFFVENECKKDLEPEAYSIIKGMAQFFRENMHNY